MTTSQNIPQLGDTVRILDWVTGQHVEGTVVEIDQEEGEYGIAMPPVDGFPPVAWYQAYRVHIAQEVA